MSDAAAPDHPATTPSTATLPLQTSVTRPRPGVVLLSVDGELDSLVATEFEAALGEALDAAEELRAGTVVDLGAVTFLASSGLAVLIRGAHREAERGRMLHVAAPTRAVLRPLQVTGADALFAVFTDVTLAVEAAAGAEVGPGVAPSPGE
jgi:anti-sigma B factor antagonist